MLHPLANGWNPAQPFQGCGTPTAQTQGSSFVATLGFKAESLWDSRFEKTSHNGLLSIEDLRSDSTFRGEDVNRAPGRVEHVILFSVGTSLDCNANAITFGAIDYGDHFFEFAICCEAFDACGRPRFSSQDVSIGENAKVLRLAAAAEIARLDLARLTELCQFLAIAVVRLDRVPRIVWYPQLATARLNIHLTATPVQRVHDQLWVSQ